MGEAASWPFRWPHGEGMVQALGGMAGPVHFNLPSGRVFSPLAIAPWREEEMPGTMPGHLRALRGVFPCLPFGVSPRPREAGAGWQELIGVDAPDPPHGAAANGLWRRLAASGGDALQIGYDHADGPILAEQQSFRGMPDTASLTIAYSARVRREIRLPFGYHVLARWPPASEPVELRPGRFAVGLTYPGIVEPNRILVRPNAAFDALRAVPAATGGPVDLTRPDHVGPIEDVVQLCGIEGVFEVLYPGERAGLRITWDGRVMPSCLLWLSRFGLTEAPWNGRFTAIGIEPIAAAFDLSPEISTVDNPIWRRGVATAIALSPDRRFETSISLSAFEW